jgi:hypothetical protein
MSLFDPGHAQVTKTIIGSGSQGAGSQPVLIPYRIHRLPQPHGPSFYIDTRTTNITD